METIVRPKTNAPLTLLETKIAIQSSKVLAKLKHPRIRLQVSSSKSKTKSIEFPPSAVPLLKEILSGLAKGKLLTVVSSDAEITTQQTASILNVSRPHVVSLLESRELPFRKVGKHRRVLLQDVLAYKNRLTKNRLKALAELGELDQKLGLGY